MPSVFIKTFGCQMNERDSEAVAAQFIAQGFALAPNEAAADVVLLNTCSVRDAAEQKALGKMNALAGGPRRKRAPKVYGFLGCMAQSRGEELIAQLPGVNLVLGTQKFHRAAAYSRELLSGARDQVCDVGDEAGSEAALRDHVLDAPGTPRSVTAYVSIMQGCNQHCTFCIVPQTRGEERSRSIEDLVMECRELAAKGVREVTLLGQIVTSYGRREIPVRDGLSPFVQLLEAVSAVEGLERIRFTSPHPKGYGEDLIEAFGRLPKLCEHAHIPVQSGSNRILKLMHRGYNRERFLGIVEGLRRTQPEIGIWTDIVVGFPGETEADFAETMNLVREAQFDSAFVFKYSPRRNTPAAESPDQIPEAVIEERHARLFELVNEVGGARLQRFVGQTTQILVEGPSRKNPARFEGRTRCNRITVLEGSSRHVGQLVNVQVERASKTTLYATAAILDPA